MQGASASVIPCGFLWFSEERGGDRGEERTEGEGRGERGRGQERRRGQRRGERGGGDRSWGGDRKGGDRGGGGKRGRGHRRWGGDRGKGREERRGWGDTGDGEGSKERAPNGLVSSVG